MKKWFVLGLIITLGSGAPKPAPVNSAAPLAAPAENTLAIPAVGDQQLRVLSPTLLELTLITTKDPTNPPTEWNFVGPNFKLQLPPPADVIVKVDGHAAVVKTLGFKRRPVYAPLKRRDLRIGNYLYVELAEPVATNATLEILAPGGHIYTGRVEPLRFNPAIHVNQVGYGTTYPKKATVGFFIGSLGELPIPAEAGFTVVDAATGHEVYRGKLTLHPDREFRYTVVPYQQVYTADFSELKTPGEYRVAVAGLGASFPFTISDTLAADFARTYALGIYHQRCGAALELPFTRFTHAPCHTAPAEIPTAEFKTVQSVLAGDTANFAKSQAPGTPRMDKLDACLYPYVKTGKVDVTQGHHDAGDYSKYTGNSASFIHSLSFAVDVMPGVGALDNLGLPESGDGKSDVLQLAKWEADFMAKMQDDDGGFYFMVYPRDRKYEGDVLPENGDPQVVYPKTTAVTAVGVASLAQMARSSLFQKQFPKEAALYLEKAKRGWEFLERAWAKYGEAGAYQKITHYGDAFKGKDEIVWAATEMYLATGEERYHARVLKEFDPSDPNTRHWGWVRLSDNYGNAIRSYAFADRTAPDRKLDATLLKKCRDEILAAGQDQVNWADACAYGTSYPIESKHFKVAGWYFPVPNALDSMTAYLLDPKPEFLSATFDNLNFEAGANPNNVAFLTGVGWRRQHEIVSQFAQNARRVLPPDGIPLGALQAGFPYIDHYKKDLGALTFPWDGDKDSPYPFYDRWGETFNTTTEFVAVQQARGLGWLAYLMAQSPVKQQTWKSAPARIVGLPAEVVVGAKVSARLEVDGLDLSGARIVWEARDQQPAFGRTFEFVPAHSGIQWVEAEAEWPDGRRAFAVATFQAQLANGGQPRSSDSNTRLFFNFDNLPEGPLVNSDRWQVVGQPIATSENLGWMTQPAGKVIKFSQFTDGLKIPVAGSEKPRSDDSLKFSAWLYVEKWPYGHFTGPVFSFTCRDGNESILGLNCDMWLRPPAPVFFCGDKMITHEELYTAISLNEWQYYEITYQDGNFTFKIDGKLVKSGPVADAKKVGRQLLDKSLAIKLGNFIGYIDEVCLQSPAS